MADPRELLLGTPEEADDYHRWAAGRSANVRDPNGVVSDLKNTAQSLWDNKTNILLSAVAPPRAHIAAALGAGDTVMPAGEEPPVRAPPSAEPPARTPSQPTADVPTPANPKLWGDPTQEELVAKIRRMQAESTPGVPPELLTEDFQSPLAKQILSRPDYAPTAIYDQASGQTMMEAARELEEAHRLGYAQVGQPGRGNFPPEPPRAPAPEPNVGAPGKMVDAAEAERMIAAADGVKLATRAGRLEALAARLGPAADAVAVGTLPFAAAAALGLKAVDMTPEAELRYQSFDAGHGPLDMGGVGRHVTYLRAHPDVATKLWTDGVLSTPAYAQIMDPGRQLTGEDLLDARQARMAAAMRRVEAQQ